MNRVTERCDFVIALPKVAQGTPLIVPNRNLLSSDKKQNKDHLCYFHPEHNG